MRTRNEAELAAVLGHEFGHFEKRHGLAGFKKARSSTDLLAWNAVLTAMSRSASAYQAYRDLEFSVYGALFQHNRNQEREADLLGIGYLNTSNLRPQAAAEVWRNLMGEIEASAEARGLKKPNFKAIAFTASHPPEGERAEYLTRLADPAGEAHKDGADRYQQMLAPWLPEFLQDQIRLNDFGASDYLIQHLAERGWTAPLWFARGELYRVHGSQRDLVHAAEFYRSAISLDPSLADAYRGLGLSLIKTGERSSGMEALGTYLKTKPDAKDAAMIRTMLLRE